MNLLQNMKSISYLLCSFFLVILGCKDHNLITIDESNVIPFLINNPEERNCNYFHYLDSIIDAKPDSFIEVMMAFRNIDSIYITNIINKDHLGFSHNFNFVLVNNKEYEIDGYTVHDKDLDDFIESRNDLFDNHIRIGIQLPKENREDICQTWYNYFKVIDIIRNVIRDKYKGCKESNYLVFTFYKFEEVSSVPIPKATIEAK